MTECRLTPHGDALVTLYILHKAAWSKSSLWACLLCQVQSLSSYAYSMNRQVTKQLYSRRQVDTPSHGCRSLLLLCSSCFLTWLISTDSVPCSCMVSRPELGFALWFTVSACLIIPHLPMTSGESIFFHGLQPTFKGKAYPISLWHKHSHLGGLDHLNVVHGRLTW